MNRNPGWITGHPKAFGNCLINEKKRTVVFTHHNLEKGFAAADRVMILSRGRVFFAPDGKCSLTELQDAYSASLEAA
jgi:ABC-type multidrug transport system ATPase subunit